MKLVITLAIVAFLAVLMSGCGTNTAPTSSLSGLKPAVSATPSAAKQIFRGGPSSATPGQIIPTVPGLTLKLYAYSDVAWFGAELPTTEIGEYYVAEGASFAPCIGQTRGGPSNQAIVYSVSVEDGRDYVPQAQNTANISYKLEPGQYIVWASLMWEGQSVDVGTAVKVTADPNLPKLQMTIDTSDIVSGTKKVRLIVSNLQPGTTAPDTKVFASFNGNILSAWATCDYTGTVKSGVATLTFAGKATLVPGSVRVVEMLGRGGPSESDFENDPASLTTGVRVGNLSPNADKAVTCEVNIAGSQPNLALSVVKTADPDYFFTLTTTVTNNSGLSLPWVVLKSNLNGSTLNFSVDGASPASIEIPTGWELRQGTIWSMGSEPSNSNWVWCSGFPVNLGSIPAGGWKKIRVRLQPITQATVTVYPVNPDGSLGAAVQPTASTYRYIVDEQRYKVVAHFPGRNDSDLICTLGNRYNPDFPTRTTAWLSGSEFWCINPGCNEIYVTVYDKAMTKLGEAWFPVMVPTPDNGGGLG